jgi:hypothetical protein
LVLVISCRCAGGGESHAKLVADVRYDLLLEQRHTVRAFAELAAPDLGVVHRSHEFGVHVQPELPCGKPSRPGSNQPDTDGDDPGALSPP